MADSIAPNVLVLGATGIIGQRLCEVATSSGYNVIAVSRHPKPLSSARNIEHIALNVRDLHALNGALKGRYFDAAIDLLSFTPEHVHATLEVLHGIATRYVFISSATVSAPAAMDAEITEDSRLVVDGWRYPINKLACEAVVRQLANSHHQDFTIIRPYVTYSEARLPFGPWEESQVLPMLKYGLPIVIPSEVASATTAITHTDDLARGIVALTRTSMSHGDVFQVVSPELTTWRRIFECAAEALDVELNLHTIPLEEFNSIWPDLAGKSTDRAMSRVFSAQKLRSAVPDFEFRFDVRSGYMEILRGLQAKAPQTAEAGPGFGPRDLGRYARMTAKMDEGDRFTEFASRLNGLDRVKYLVGRYASLDHAHQALGSIRSKGGVSRDYG